jgi:alpha-amylase
MGRIVCYNNITYNGDRSSAEVEARCRQHSSIAKVEYNWADTGYSSKSTFSATGSL